MHTQARSCAHMHASAGRESSGSRDCCLPSVPDSLALCKDILSELMGRLHFLQLHKSFVVTGSIMAQEELEAINPTYGRKDPMPWIFLDPNSASRGTHPTRGGTKAHCWPRRGVEHFPHPVHLLGCPSTHNITSSQLGGVSLFCSLLYYPCSERPLAHIKPSIYIC